MRIYPNFETAFKSIIEEIAAKGSTTTSRIGNCTEILSFNYRVTDLSSYQFEDESVGRLPYDYAETFYDWMIDGAVDHKLLLDKYPNITKEFFAKKGIQIETIKLNGSMELAPSLKMCRRIVDLVSTGRTLKENGLTEVEEIMKVQSKLITNRSSFKTDTDKIQKIIQEIKNLVL